jgi:hypothetical protein
MTDRYRNAAESRGSKRPVTEGPFLLRPWSILLVVACSFAVIALYLTLVLQFDLMQSDALWYWEDAQSWRAPFNPYHVPAYPLMAALLNALTFHVLSPLALMMALNLAALLGGTLLVYRLARGNGVDGTTAAVGAYVFAFWPAVGIVYCVHPLADMPAITLFLAGLLALQRSRLLAGGVFLGLSLVAHKVLWPFVAIVVILDSLSRKLRLSSRNLMAAVSLGTPIVLLWTFGAIHHNSALWLITKSAGVESQRISPILDGILQTFARGGFIGLAKGILVGGLAALSAVLLYFTYRFKTDPYRQGIALSAVVLIMFLALNEIEIWAGVRYGRLLVLPLVWLIGQRYALTTRGWLAKAVIACLLALLLASQFAFAWYMARVYFV